MIMKYQVVGSLPIADVTAPDVVDLDPDMVNIQALIEAGHIKEIKEDSKKAVKPRGGGDE